MIEAPPLPEFPPLTGDEKQTLTSFLDYMRIVMMRKVSSISDEDVRRVMTPSGLSLLGIVKHLADVERWWFRAMFLGEDVELTSSDADPDADFRIEPHETTQQIVESYRAEIERANEIAATAGLEDVSARETPRGRRPTMRWILVHMIEETARHCGHADLMRETLDGGTGD